MAAFLLMSTCYMSFAPLSLLLPCPIFTEVLYAQTVTRALN